MGVALTETSDPTRVLYYGDGGVGKTSAMMGMARLGKILVINAEKGVKASALKKLGIPIKNIEVYPGPGEKITYESLAAEIQRVSDALDKDPNAYVGLVWDSATEILSALLDEAVAAGYVKAQRLGKSRERFFVDIADYGTVTTQLRQLIRASMDLPVHFAVSALAKREQDDDGTVAYVISVTPAFRKDLVGWVDIVIYNDTITIGDEDVYRGLSRPRGKFYGKDRLGALPPRLMNPSFDRIVGYVEEKIQVATDPEMARVKKMLDAHELKTAASAAETKTEDAP